MTSTGVSFVRALFSRLAADILLEALITGKTAEQSPHPPQAGIRLGEAGEPPWVSWRLSYQVAAVPPRPASAP